MIELQNIRKCFGEQEILSGFSYTFPTTGLYCLTGESGRGKTTLLRIIAGLERDFDGRVTGEYTVSFLFQDKRLFPTLTALENVTVVADKRKNDRHSAEEFAKKLLRRLNISDEDFGKLPAQLSGGMQQRVAIARALYFDAPVLLLDEPSKELDEQNKECLRELICEEAARRLVIAVSHDERDIRAAGAVRIPL